MLLPLSALAQKEAGTIEGTIKDAEGRAISGAIVTVTSPSLIGGSAVTHSGEDGFYRFLVLASGNYEVRASLSGFRSVSAKDVRVFVGKTLTIDFQLEFDALTAVVEVAGRSPLIDVKTTAVSVTVPPEIIVNLPKQSIRNLYALTPGVGDDLIAYGADGEKAINSLVDGVSVSSPHGQQTVRLAYDYNWIDEFQVNGIGAPAEYGGFTGVVGNFTTRSGGNEFHGLFETFFQNENLVSTNVPDPQPEVPFKSYDISTQLGGPVYRDKLWFFAGLHQGHQENYRPGFDVAKTKGTELITKLTYKWNENNNLQGLFQSGVSSDYPGSTPNFQPEAVIRYAGNQCSWNVTWISLIKPQTSFEGRLGGFYNEFYDENDNPDLPGHYDVATDVYSLNSPYGWDQSESSIQIKGALSHYAADFLNGSHDFRFGVQYESSDAYLSEYNFHGGLLYYDLYGAPFQRLRSAGREWDGTNRSLGSYAQDDWSLNQNLILSLGIRWDHNRGKTDRGVVFATDPVAPRLGLVWNLHKKTETVLKAHYGDYYSALLNRYYSFLTDEYITTSREEFNPTTDQWEQIGAGFYESYIADETFKHPRVRQFTVGFERVLPGQIPLGIHYIYRRYGNIIEDVSISDFEALPYVNPLTGEIMTVYNQTNFNREYFVTNPPELYRSYDGIQLTASKYLFKNLSVMGSFVYSRLKGTYPGDIQGNSNTMFLDTPNSLINFPGKLQNDPTIAWKIAGTYLLPFGFNTGWFLRHESGDTYTATANPFLPCCPRIRIFVESAGSRRLPSQTLLDLRVEKQLSFFGGQFRFAVDMFNVFNSAFVTSVEARVESPNFGKEIEFTEPRRIRLGIRYAF
jgi:hypothetical protein